MVQRYTFLSLSDSCLVLEFLAVVYIHGISDLLYFGCIHLTMQFNHSYLSFTNFILTLNLLGQCFYQSILNQNQRVVLRVAF